MAWEYRETLTPQDNQQLSFIEGDAKVRPGDMSPEAQAAILRKLVSVLKRDDQAFSSLNKLATSTRYAPGNRIFDLYESGLKFAYLAAYTEFPGRSRAMMGSPEDRESEHLLLQRPEKDADEPFFWNLYIKWHSENALQSMEWKAVHIFMRPLTGLLLAEAMSKPVIRTVGGHDVLTEAVRTLMRISSRTMIERQNTARTYEMLDYSLCENAHRMGITLHNS